MPPGVLMDGDGLGKWLEQQQPVTWARLSTKQQRLTALGVKPAERPAAAPTGKSATKGGPSKAQQAFQRGLAALTQWVER